MIQLQTRLAPVQITLNCVFLNKAALIFRWTDFFVCLFSSTLAAGSKRSLCLPPDEFSIIPLFTEKVKNISACSLPKHCLTLCHLSKTIPQRFVLLLGSIQKSSFKKKTQAAQNNSLMFSTKDNFQPTTSAHYYFCAQLQRDNLAATHFPCRAAQCTCGKDYPCELPSHVMLLQAWWISFIH